MIRPKSQDSTFRQSNRPTWVWYQLVEELVPNTCVCGICRAGLQLEAMTEEEAMADVEQVLRQMYPDTYVKPLAYTVSSMEG